MLKQMEIFLIAAVFILITAIILIFNTMQREQEFISHNKEIQKSAVHGAAYAIDQLLKNKRRHLTLFLNEYQPLVAQLVRFPNDEKTESDIKLRLSQRFPDFFTFTITNQNGVPVMDDIDSLVGEACQRDLTEYAQSAMGGTKTPKNKIFIHPQPYHYHYDIMAPLFNGGAVTRIFFTRFYLNDIADILKTHETPGQNLMLLKQSDPELIEVTRNGTRDKLDREMRLSTEEVQRIGAFERIDNTDWRLVNVSDTDYEQDYLHGLWKEAIIIMLVVTAALILLIFVLVKLTGKEIADSRRSG